MERIRRSRRKPRVLRITMISLLLLVVLTAGSLFIFKDKINLFTKKEPPVVVKTGSVLIENGLYLQTESKDASTYTSYVAYPETDIEAIDLPIHQWVTEQEKTFYDEMEQTEMLLGKDFQAHFDVQTEVIAKSDHVLSFLLTAKQSVEKDNEYSLINSYTVDLNKERFISLTDILNESDIEKDGLYLLVKDQLKANEELNEKIDKNLLKAHLNDIENLKWSIGEDSIKLHFNPLEISSHPEIHSVEIDIIDIYKAVKDDYRDILISENKQAEIDRLEEELKKPIVRELDTNGKYIALTFDDGPHANVTPRILDTLEQYDAKATFYMLGQNAEMHPTTAKEVADAGHEIANHSISHANLNTISAEKIREEMTKSADQIEAATGIKPTTFRPPYGNYNQTVLDIAKETEQSIVLWTIDTLDWESRNADAVFEEIKKSAKAGSIVLMHDIHKTTADALPQIMKYLTEEGYEFVTVSELMPLLNGEGIGPYHGIR